MYLRACRDENCAVRHRFAGVSIHGGRTALRSLRDAHTTFIPYREFESVLGIHGIDEYIRYGGTMSLGGVHYNETSTFASKESTDEYVDTAIARNIQHSLRCYQYEGHFRHLHDLYEKDELTSAINRVVEDINHRFTLEVLTRDFKSHDLGISANNLRRDRQNPTDILDRVDMDTVTENLRKLLEIRNQAEQTVKLDRTHVREIREYLELLDLTQEIDVLHLPDVNEKGSRTVIAQPGLRYAQAGALFTACCWMRRSARCLWQREMPCRNVF